METAGGKHFGLGDLVQRPNPQGESVQGTGRGSLVGAGEKTGQDELRSLRGLDHVRTQQPLRGFGHV